MALFDSQFLKQLEYLSLVSKRMFRGQLLAQRRTMQLGTGIEFADHRDYSPGDDLRYLDWNIFARHGELLLKRFQEEEDLHVYVLLDCSRSMAIGQPPKLRLAKQLAAAVAYIALADLDRVSILAFSHELEREFPLTRGKDQVLRLLDFLEGIEANGQTSLGKVVQLLEQRARRAGLAIIISDWLDPAGFQPPLDRLRHRKFEPHLIHLFAEEDANPKVLGDVELWDPECGDFRKVTLTEKHIAEYQSRFAAFEREVQRYAKQYGLGFLKARSDVPFDQCVLSMMREAGAVQ